MCLLFFALRQILRKYGKKNAGISILFGTRGLLPWKNAWLPPVFFVDSDSPC